MTTQLKAGTSNAPEVIIFDFDTSTITSNTKELGTANNISSNGLCTATNCYNCTETQCNQVKCSNVQCSNVQCNQVHCNQVRCSTVKCNQKQCSNCSQCSNCHTDDCRD